jgi:hypothetical protein
MITDDIYTLKEALKAVKKAERIEWDTYHNTDALEAMYKTAWYIEYRIKQLQKEAMKK